MAKRTPFFEIHKQAGANMTDFGGWEMPVRYSSIKQEHQVVRQRVGLFDVSHMGEVFIHGPEALDLIQQVTINDASRLSPGKAQYSAMCYEDGGMVDDLLVYMFDDELFMVVVNASNITKDFDWITRHNNFEAKVENKSDDMCLLAVQGPDSVKTLQKLTDTDLSAIKFYTFEKGPFAGNRHMIMSATGYTGEKGFEIYFDKHDAAPREVWEAIMQAGGEFDIEPCGLGARDTLRLEMGFALYGNDISKETNPLEARMSWLTKLNKGNFIGKKALQKVKKDGINRKLMGLVLDEPRAIARSGYAIVDENEDSIGHVTSGGRSITLGKNIGMGYVTADKAGEGTTVSVQIRGKNHNATITKPPFLDRS